MPSSSSFYVLQKVRHSDKTLVGTIAAGGLTYEGNSWRGTVGDYISFDGIFGALFDGYWTRHTHIADLAIILDLFGRIELVVERVCSTTGWRNELVCSTWQGSGERITVPIPLRGSGETRLVLTLRLLDDSEIRSLAWVTSTPPVRPVGLNIVICTFNRDQDVGATLSELQATEAAFRRVLVVNQGDPGLAERLPQVRSAIGGTVPTVIDQPNLGGAGGFGRGMLESLFDEGCSHILLMDDDIDLDGDIIARLMAILAYVRQDHAIGGAMLDRSERTRLFSVGDVLHETKPEIRNLIDPAASDVTTEAGRRFLAKNHQPDFNAWWFFAFPKSAVEAVGMPLPLFIRGDDVEYGFRLASAGIRTLAWPGLAVWHIPFHLKRHPWHYFYNLRNSMYLCEMNGRFRRIRLLNSLVTGFLNHLLRFDYDRAACVALGLGAFNEGPERLAAWNAEDHARLILAFGSNERPAVGNVGQGAMQSSRLPVSLLFAVRLVGDLVRSSPPIGEPVAIASTDWRPIIRRRPERVRVHYLEAGSMADYARDRDRTRSFCIGFARELWRFLFRPWRPERLAPLTRPDFWARYVA